MSDTIPLTRLPDALRKHCGAPLPLTFDQLYRRALNGVIPTQRTSTNRITVAVDDIPKIAATLGLPAKARRSA